MDEWTEQDAAAARDFFLKPSGQKFLGTLKARAPKLKECSTMESAAMNGQLVKGVADTLDTIESLIYFTQPKAGSSFINPRGPNVRHSSEISRQS